MPRLAESSYSCETGLTGPSGGILIAEIDSFTFEMGVSGEEAFVARLRAVPMSSSSVCAPGGRVVNVFSFGGGHCKVTLGLDTEGCVVSLSYVVAALAVATEVTRFEGEGSLTPSLLSSEPGWS